MSLSHEQRIKVKEIKEALKGTTVREQQMMNMMRQMSIDIDARIAKLYNKIYVEHVERKTKS